MSYQAPVKDMMFTIRELAGLAQVRQLPGFSDATDDTVEGEEIIVTAVARGQNRIESSFHPPDGLIDHCQLLFDLLKRSFPLAKHFLPE